MRLSSLLLLFAGCATDPVLDNRAIDQDDDTAGTLDGDTGAGLVPQSAFDDTLVAEDVGDPPPPSSPSRSASGFYSPIASTLSYNCAYGSSFTTLFLDNEDSGSTASRTSGYTGSRCDTYDAYTGSKYNGQYCGAHPGVDISISSGNAIYAITSGTIYSVTTGCTTSSGTGCGGGWGNNVILQFTATSGTSTVTAYAIYAHLTSVSTNPSTGRTWAAGNSVSAASQLGTTGNTGNSTGAHLHFQIDKSFSGSGFSHPFWGSMVGSPGVSTPDYSDSLHFTNYVYNPLYAIGFGTCG